MKKVLIVFSLLLLASFACAINVSGPVSGTWAITDSPVNVTGEISVQPGDELTIEPGVVVNFQNHHLFQIFGTLLSEGIEGTPITFQATTTWNGIRFINTAASDSSFVTYTNFTDGAAMGASPNYQGGALYFNAASNVVLDNVNISDCTATTGGAIYLDNSDITIKATTIDGNIASGAGGGIYLNNSNPTITGSFIINNESTYDGAGINCFASSPIIETTVIADNITEWNGGGISCYNGSEPVLTNVTLSENIAYQDGCGIAVLYNSYVSLMNTIVWNNDSHDLYVSSTGELKVEYSDVTGGEEAVTVETGGVLNWVEDTNIDVDPLFTSAFFDDFSLTASSECIDAGNPLPEYDDPDGSRNDMGAIFFRQAGIRGSITFPGGQDVDFTEITITISGDADIVVNPNENGVYFINLPAGNYRVKPYLESFNPSPLFIDVTLADEELAMGIDFEMQETQPGYVEGWVTLVGSLDELTTGVTISADQVSTNPYPVYDLFDVLIGYYYQLTINPGDWTITASLEGFTSEEQTVTVNPTQITDEVNFDLSPIVIESYVTGTVTLNGGTGDITQVKIYEGEDDGESETYANPDGSYYLVTHNGELEISASLSGYATISIDDINVAPYQTAEDINFVLQPWAQIEGTQYVMSMFITVSYDGQFICGEDSNILGAFGLPGVDDCRGTAVWVEGNHPFWDTSITCYDLPGYWYITVVSDNNSGEPIEFQIYESNTDLVYNIGGITSFENCTYDNPDNVRYFNIEQTEQPTHDIEVNSEIGFDLISGWNWISFNLSPSIIATDVVFDDLTITPDIYQIKHEGYSTTWMSAWIGDAYLDYIQNGDGYKINMLNAYEDFVVTGTKINPIVNPIIIEPGYNWIAYYPYEEMDLSTSLSCILTDSLYVKTQAQSAFYSGGTWIGDLTSMKPGLSYLVDYPEDEAKLLFYPMNAENDMCFNPDRGGNIYVSNDVVTDLATGWSVIQGTSSNMISMASFNLETSNNTVAIFDEAGNCRSLGIEEDGFYYFTIVGDVENEELHYVLYDKTENREFVSNETITYKANTISGSSSEPVRVTFDAPTPDVNEQFQLEQNHPNPFNPTTFIAYNLPEASNVKLQIFNVKGQLVETLVEANQIAGKHTIEWDATAHGSGIYFYKLSANGKTEIKKCVMLK